MDEQGCTSDQWYNFICSPLEPIHNINSIAFDEAEGPLIYSHVSCEGWEDDIRKYKKQMYENFTCPSYYTAAGVRCSNSMDFNCVLLILMLNFSFIECTMGEARLVNGDTENEGTVEICYHDLWGLISDLDWDESDAEVVCRQLGYRITSMLHDN